MRQFLLVGLVFCAMFASEPSQAATEPLLINGYFETGDLTGWKTSSAVSRGVLVQPPFSLGDLNFTSSATGPTTRAVQAATASALPIAVGASSMTSRWPFAGGSCAAIHPQLSGATADTLWQDFVLRYNQLQTDDGRLHLQLRAMVAFWAVAHANFQKPFLLISIDNVTQSKAGIASFYINSGASTATMWASDARNAQVRVSPWLYVPLTVPLASAEMGDTLRLNITAAGCGVTNGGHLGEAYIDSVEAFASQPAVAITAPSAVNANAPLVYKVQITHGLSVAQNVVFQATLPSNTTFVSFGGAPPGACSVSGSSAPQVVSCSFAVLPQLSQTQFRMQVQPNAGAVGVAQLDNYSIRAANTTPSWGVPVTTTLAQVTTLADLRVTTRAQLATIGKNPTTMEVTAINLGPAAVTGARLQDQATTAFAGRSYSCTATMGASCNGSASQTGSGALALDLNIPVGGQVTCQISLPTDSSQVGTQARFGAIVSTPNGVVDPQLGDNEAGIVFGVGPLAMQNNTAVTSCLSNGDCSSGFCADGVCCDTACTQTCMACDTVAAPGVCSPVVNQAPHNAATCGPYVCGQGVCLGSCQSDADCISAYSCGADQVCRARAGVCRTDADCPTGRFCTPLLSCESPATQDSAHPAWVLYGSGCAGNNPKSSLGALLLPLLCAWRLRRKSGKSLGVWLLALGALLPSSRAQAAAADAIPLQHLQLLGGHNDILNSASAIVAPRWGWQLFAAGHYARSPLRLLATQPRRTHFDLVRHQGIVELGGGVSFPGRIELDVVVPFLMQRITRAAFISSDYSQARLANTLGDARVTPKVVLWQGHGVWTALAAPVGIPLSDGKHFAGLGGFSVNPRLLLEYQGKQNWNILLNGGALLRGRRAFLTTYLHNAITWSAAARYRLPGRGHRFVTSLGAFGEVGIGKRYNATPVEALLAQRVDIAAGVHAEVSAGLGMQSGYGTPYWRAFAMLGYSHPRPAAAAETHTPSAMPAESQPSLTPGYVWPSIHPLEGPPAPARVPAPVSSAMPPPPQLTSPLASGSSAATQMAPVPSAAPMPLQTPTSAQAAITRAAKPNDAVGSRHGAAATQPAAAVTAFGHDRDHDGIDDADDNCPDVAGTGTGVHIGCPVSNRDIALALGKLRLWHVTAPDNGSWDAADGKVLESVRQIMVNVPRINLAIDGFAPAALPSGKKAALSAARAQAAANWLAQHGIAAKRLQAIGQGGAKGSAQAPAAQVNFRLLGP